MNLVQKIFILGDSRTGTSSFHLFFQEVGLKSIHYYESEANMVEHSDENYLENSRRILEFIDKSEYQVFSDYPTRLYYQKIYEKYEDAIFILTSRTSTEVWRKSMENYFGYINLDELAQAYIELNHKIRCFFSGHDRFFDIVIGDGDDNEFCRLKDFLNIDPRARLPVVNRWQDKTN